MDTEQREPCRRKTLKGIVVSNKMTKTAVIGVDTRMRHPRFEKVITRRKNYYAHAPEELTVGLKVEIEETRPLSKKKRWRVTKVLGQEK